MSGPLSDRKRRLAFVYDYPHWILGTIAGKTAARINSDSTAWIASARPEPLSPLSALRLCCRHDVLFFLNPHQHLKWPAVFFKPSILMFHHFGPGTKEKLVAALRHVDCLCAPNQAMVAALASMSEEVGLAVFLVPYCVDTDQFFRREGGHDELVKLTGCPRDTTLLGLAASPHSGGERKGIDRYWELMSRLQVQFGEKVRLVIMGPGADARGWDVSMIPLQIRSVVSILPFQKIEQMPLLYSGLDFYVCLSRIEGGPYPVLESMACGTKVISTPVGVVPDLIRDGESGFIVSGEDYLQRIPAIISACRQDPSRFEYVGGLAREMVVAQCSYGSVHRTAWYEHICDTASQHWGTRSLWSQVRRRVGALVCASHDVLARPKDYLRAGIRLSRVIIGRLAPGVSSANRGPRKSIP